MDWVMSPVVRCDPPQLGHPVRLSEGSSPVELANVKKCQQSVLIVRLCSATGKNEFCVQTAFSQNSRMGQIGLGAGNQDRSKGRCVSPVRFYTRGWKRSPTAAATDTLWSRFHTTDCGSCGPADERSSPPAFELLGIAQFVLFMMTSAFVP